MNDAHVSKNKINTLFKDLEITTIKTKILFTQLIKI